MTLEDFIETVRKMRTYQSAYFKDRRPFDLMRAKAFEKKVDQALEEGIIIPILDTRPDNPEPVEQIGMFEDIPEKRFEIFDPSAEDLTVIGIVDHLDQNWKETSNEEATQ